MYLIELKSQCPSCPAQATNRFDSEELRDALQRNDLTLYCHYCDHSWKASPEDLKLAKRLLHRRGSE